MGEKLSDSIDDRINLDFRNFIYGKSDDVIIEFYNCKKFHKYQQMIKIRIPFIFKIRKQTLTHISI